MHADFAIYEYGEHSQILNYDKPIKTECTTLIKNSSVALKPVIASDICYKAVKKMPDFIDMSTSDISHNFPSSSWVNNAVQRLKPKHSSISTSRELLEYVLMNYVAPTDLNSHFEKLDDVIFLRTFDGRNCEAVDTVNSNGII